jgi:hypothetical protein
MGGQFVAQFRLSFSTRLKDMESGPIPAMPPPSHSTENPISSLKNFSASAKLPMVGIMGVIDCKAGRCRDMALLFSRENTTGTSVSLLLKLLTIIRSADRMSSLGSNLSMGFALLLSGKSMVSIPTQEHAQSTTIVRRRGPSPHVFHPGGVNRASSVELAAGVLPSSARHKWRSVAIFPRCYPGCDQVEPSPGGRPPGM